MKLIENVYYFANKNAAENHLDKLRRLGDIGSGGDVVKADDGFVIKCDDLVWGLDCRPGPTGSDFCADGWI